MENFKNGGISIPAGQLYTLTYLIGKSSFTATDVNSRSLCITGR
jgi:hypothetical protein